MVATVSLGAPRRFLIRPKGGGASLAFSIGGSDLVVMGGSCQRTHDHAIPKVSSAGERIALMFRPEWHRSYDVPMRRLPDRLARVRTVVVSGALGFLFLGVAARMVLDGQALVDQLWAIALGIGCVSFAVVGVWRYREALRFERLRARAAARAASRADRSLR